jgi:hypothetical protein
MPNGEKRETTFTEAEKKSFVGISLDGTHTSRQRKKGIRFPLPNQTLMVCLVMVIEQRLTLR